MTRPGVARIRPAPKARAFSRFARLSWGDLPRIAPGQVSATLQPWRYGHRLSGVAHDSRAREECALLKGHALQLCNRIEDAHPSVAQTTSAALARRLYNSNAVFLFTTRRVCLPCKQRVRMHDNASE